MQLYDMFNQLYLGSFTTALFAWGEESNEGRDRLMAVVRALRTSKAQYWAFTIEPAAQKPRIIYFQRSCGTVPNSKKSQKY